MSSKSRAGIYLLIGTIVFIIGLVFIYEEVIALGILFIGVASPLLFVGFSTLFSDDTVEVSVHEPIKCINIDESEPKKEHTTPPLGSLLAAIDLTLMALDDAFDKKSKHISRKATAKLDFSIYLFFKYYCALCNTQNEALVTYYIQFALDSLKEHFSSKMSESKVDRIIDDRIIEYDRIVQTSGNFAEDITDAMEQHLIQDLYYTNPGDETVFIADANTRLEINVELIVINEYISYKINPIYDNLISEWNNYVKN